MGFFSLFVKATHYNIVKRMELVGQLLEPFQSIPYVESFSNICELICEPTWSEQLDYPS
jgi:hypothetical protein